MQHHTVEDGVIKLPQSAKKSIRSKDDGLDRRKVLNIKTADEPAAARKAAEIRGRLQKASEMAGVRRICRSVVKCCESPSSVHQSSVTSTGDGDGYPWEAGASVCEIVDVSASVKTADIGAAEHIFHGLDCVICAKRKPICFVGRQARGRADRWPMGWA